MACSPDFATTVTFVHPFAGGSGALTLTLAAPVFNNIEALDLKTSYGTSMDATIHSYIKTPPVSKLTMTYNRLDTNLKDELITFLDTVGGDDMKFTDWLGTVWQGKFSLNPVQIQETKELYSVTLEFEGTEVT